jgi:sulfide:quinone oxidoreductase
MTRVHRVVVAGGGPAAIELLLALRELAGERAALELIAPDPDLVVRAYEVLAPFHEGRERRYQLAPIAAALEAELVRDSLLEVDSRAQTIVLRSRAHRRYDSLVLAVGARHHGALPGALPFRGARDAPRLRALLLEAHAGGHRRIAFVVPSGHVWPLPLYELALASAVWLAERRIGGVPLMLVSPERRPLAAFGSRASGEVEALLDERGIEFVSAHAVRHDSGRLLLAGGRGIDVDLAIATPRLVGPRIGGLPSDEEGFLPVDDLGRVTGVESVYAAGDATTFPIKHGGLATQQADMIAAVLAAQLGAEVEPVRVPPVLRAVLFTGDGRRYLQAELGDALERSSTASASPLWPVSSKLVGRYLAPALDALERAGSVDPAPAGAASA